MPRPSQDAKDAAFRSKNKAAAVAATAGGAAGGAALIPIVGPFIAAGIGAVGAAFGFRAIVQGKVVHDPPRADYFVLTALDPPVFGPGILGDSPVERIGAELVAVNDEAARALAAMVIAVERASGADLAGDTVAASARVNEAFEFAQIASRGLVTSSELSGPFVRALSEIPGEVTSPQPRRSLASQLPQSTLTTLRAAGVPDKYLRGPVRVYKRDPISALTDALNQSAEIDYGFGQYVERAVSDKTLLEPGTS
jgi:hypothetical protein